MENERENWREDPRMDAYMKEVQFQNCIGALEALEYEQGGISPVFVWQLTERLREALTALAPEERAPAIPTLFDTLLRSLRVNPQLTNDPERSLLCVGVVLGLRLVVANPNQEENPHKAIIRATVDYVSGFCYKDSRYRDTLDQLMETIGRDGDVNEAKGNRIPLGLDILAKPEVEPDGHVVRQEPDESVRQEAGRSRMRH